MMGSIEIHLNQGISEVRSCTINLWKPSNCGVIERALSSEAVSLSMWPQIIDRLTRLDSER